MLLALKEIKKLENILNKKIEIKEIENYRISLNLDTSFLIDIVGEENSDLENELNTLISVDIRIENWIDIDDYENEEYYQTLFKEKIDFSYKRRLVNLIDSSEHKKRKLPVVTFYSYKGGVGRTTSLITFANYYAYHYDKKVVILDFDFEAPGFTNYFDFSLDDLKDKNGVLEYILDKQISKEKLDLEKNYMIQVSSEYSADGSIYVMPSGNLFGKDNLNSYIEALARIDINSTDTITNQILGLIDDIDKEITPDVILIDSRTGFNDIFGLLINRISDTIVGLFEGNIQTEPGLELFLQEIYDKKNNNKINPILVNSLVHKSSGYTKRIKVFSEKVNNYIIGITEENYAPEIFDLRSHSTLGNLGTIEDDKDDYFDFIKENTPNDYKKFFEKLIEFISQNRIEENEKKKSKEIILDNQKKNRELNVEELKKLLLDKIDKNFPKRYAEEYRNEIIQYNTDFFNSKFFFRKSMEDIFNFDKFLLIGGKGTGKTMFYTALRNNEFLETLQRKANKKRLRYNSIDIISLQEDKDKDRYFEIIQFSKTKNKQFYQDFWKIYILNSIMLSKDNSLSNYKFSNAIKNILPQKLDNSRKNRIFFEEIIDNDKQFLLIEQELQNIDLFLKANNINLMITFDQLDRIVEPIRWSEAISPLIEYCNSISFQKIQPKLFLRRDLYNKLANLNNKNALDSKIINLEWSMDEVFAFFFKVVFAYSKEEFFQIMTQYNDFSQDRITRIKKDIEKPNSYNQIKLDIHWIKSLVTTFFGKYPNKNNSDEKFGRASETYDWFYNNLKDSNETISLRPFLDLVEFAIQRAFKNKNIFYPKPILGAFFYDNPEVREKYVESYFIDLAKEVGNEDFKIIIEHIRDSKFPKKYKIREFNEEQFENFSNYLINQKNIKLKAKTLADIEDILKNNGVLSVKFIRGGKRKYIFAYLYKYYLGLRG
jgi:cellulose biosynthesis protein BcsQ